MKRSSLLIAAFLLDQIAGDPEWFPHPVRLMGVAIERGETALRRPNQSSVVELASGAALTIAVVAVSYSITATAIHQTYRHSETLGRSAEILLGWTCLASRGLQREAEAVMNALASGNIRLGRERLARIVGRDTQRLDASEISRGLIETIAESASDGIIAPLFYMALGGVPLALAYKAVNTLDSMIGHADARYFYFGKIAARMDDAANYLPARLTAAGIVAASCLVSEADAPSAWRTWLRDGNKHRSPNAGQPESAMAGALRVRLGGDNTYDGETVPGQRMGEQFEAPAPKHAARAIRVVSLVALLGVGLGALLTSFGQSKRSR